MTTDLDPARLVTAVVGVRASDPVVLAAIAEWRGTTPRRAGARRRGLRDYRRPRPVPRPVTSRATLGATIQSKES